jgi:hypothetical protein
MEVSAMKRNGFIFITSHQDLKEEKIRLRTLLLSVRLTTEFGMLGMRGESKLKDWYLGYLKNCLLLRTGPKEMLFLAVLSRQK